jgi:GxxExxY protein
VVKNMLHSELSEKIIGAAMRVLNELKPGLDEKIYENALVVMMSGLDMAMRVLLIRIVRFPLQRIAEFGR